MNCPYCNYPDCFELYDLNCLPETEYELNQSYKTYYCQNCKKISKIRIEEGTDKFTFNLELEKLEQMIDSVKTRIEHRENAILEGHLTDVQLVKTKRDLEYQTIKLSKLIKQKDYLIHPEKYNDFDMFFNDDDYIFDI